MNIVTFNESVPLDVYKLNSLQLRDNYFNQGNVVYPPWGYYWYDNLSKQRIGLVKLHDWSAYIEGFSTEEDALDFVENEVNLHNWDREEEDVLDFFNEIDDTDQSIFSLPLQPTLDLQDTTQPQPDNPLVAEPRPGLHI